MTVFSLDLLHLLHQSFFGALAAVGFGVLFNFGARSLVWCAACGMLALGTRTLGLDAGWSLEGASFVASATVTTAVITLPRGPLGSSYTAMALSGCIPMVPGAFFAQALLGLFALTSPNPLHAETTIVFAIEHMLRVVFTLGAIGAGIAIPTHLLKTKDF